MNRENRVALIGSLITSLSLLCFLVIFAAIVASNFNAFLSFFTITWIYMIAVFVIIMSVSFLAIRKAFVHFKKLKNLPLFLYGALYGMFVGIISVFLAALFWFLVAFLKGALLLLSPTDMGYYISLVVYIGGVIGAIYGLILAPIIRWLANKK